MRLKLRDSDLLDRYMTDRDQTNAWLGRQVRCTRECIRQLRKGRLEGCDEELATRIEEALALLPGTLFVRPESHRMASRVTSRGRAVA